MYRVAMPASAFSDGATAHLCATTIEPTPPARRPANVKEYADKYVELRAPGVAPSIVKMADLGTAAWRSAEKTRAFPGPQDRTSYV